MLGSKFQEMTGGLCIRVLAGKLLAAPDQGEQLIFPVLRVCHDLTVSYDCCEGIRRAPNVRDLLSKRAHCDGRCEGPSMLAGSLLTPTGPDLTTLNTTGASKCDISCRIKATIC
jgi:hypothetical protein